MLIRTDAVRAAGPARVHEPDVRVLVQVEQRAEHRAAEDAQQDLQCDGEGFRSVEACRLPQQFCDQARLAPDANNAKREM